MTTTTTMHGDAASPRDHIDIKRPAVMTPTGGRTAAEAVRVTSSKYAHHQWQIQPAASPSSK